MSSEKEATTIKEYEDELELEKINKKLELKKIADKLKGKGFSYNVRYAFFSARKTPYVDSKPLVTASMKSREKFNEAIKKEYGLEDKTLDTELGIDESIENNPLKKLLKYIEQEDAVILRAINYLDLSNLLEKKTRIAKSMNDNKADVMATLIMALSAYIGSIGVMIPITLAFINQGSVFWGNYMNYAFFGIMLFGFYEGYFNQIRLQRLVMEHKDFLVNFDDITDEIDVKKKLIMHDKRKE